MLQANGSEETILLALNGLTKNERDTLLAGRLTNYYRNHQQDR